MRRIALIAMVLLCGLSLAGTNAPHAHAEEQPAVATTEQQVENEKPKTKIIKVKRGDSLSKIAKRNHSTYRRIFYFNKQLKDPDVIHPGQKLKIPSKHQKLNKRPLGAIVVKAEPLAVAKVSSATTSEPYIAPKPVVRAVSYANGSTWDRLAACESGGNWQINTGNGYYGGLQFSLSSWRGVGGQGYPHQASKAEQIRRAEMLRASGGWGHWPACSAKLGLR
jgi:resuscitation-promoting factor RpfB